MGSTTLTTPETPSRLDDSGRGSGGFSGRGYWGGREWSVPARAYRTGMWMAIAAIVMVFAAFTSALIVRQGISNDWAPTALPPILYFNTLVILMSSLTLEMSRRSLAAKRADRFARGLQLTMALGLLFLAGQLMAWRELALRGVYLSTNPSSSFFYLLTAAHGLHLLGGVLALGYVVAKAQSLAWNSKGGAVVEVTAMYWHFMDALWIYLLILMMVRL